MKVKTKKQKAKKNPELTRLFNQMTGVSDPDYHLVEGKYDRLMYLLNLFNTYLNNMTTQIKKNFSDKEKEIAELERFIEYGKETQNKYYLEEKKIDKSKNIDDIFKDMSMPRYDEKKLVEYYKQIVEDNYFKEIILTCSAMSQYSKFLNVSKTELNYNFVEKDSCHETILFTFSSLNFQDIFFDDIVNESFKIYVLFCLSLLYKVCHEMYSILTSPNIDIDKFSELLMKSIAKVKQQVPGCEKAFKKILNSVDLLKDNFEDYYKSFVKSQSPTIIIENFISDVARSTNADLITLKQFKKIIVFFEEQARLYGKKDPNINKLVSMVKTNFSKLEEEIKKEKFGRKEEKEESGDDEYVDKNNSN
jgi:hypothetical protein